MFHISAVARALFSLHGHFRTYKPRKHKIHDSVKESSLKKNKMGHWKVKNYKFESVENFKYLGVILNEDNNNQIDLQERIKNANKTYFKLQKFF